MSRYVPFFLLLSCCSFKKEQQQIFTSSTIQIPLPSICLTTYLNQDIYNNNNVIKYYGYNYLNHSFDVFGLEEGKYIKSIKLFKEGPNQIKNINGFKVLSDTSILVVNTNEIAWIDENGIKKEKVLIKDLMIDSVNQEAFIDFRAQDDIYFDSKESKLTVSISEKSPYTSKSFYLYPVIAEIDLDTKEIKVKDLFYPDIYREVFFGDFSYPIISYVNGVILVSFPNSNNFYIKQKDNWKYFNGDEKYQGIITKPLSRQDFHDGRKRIDYLYKSTFYGKMYFLSAFNKLCRMHLYSFNDDGSGNRRIEFFDFDFELDYIFQLQSNHAINYFVVENVLYINRMNEDESFLIFDKIVLDEL